ncbi:MAG: AAA family ATPase [Candidatus Acidiferrales bacterium]
MLQRLRISNWKAFEDRTVHFKDGLNLIVGPNGSGKTTILDGISLALTGGIPSSEFRGLVRNPHQEASIELEFASADGHCSVRRRFSRERIVSAELFVNNSAFDSQAWDLVNLEIARRLAIEPGFFSRIVYMSEGEVFEYAKNPPSRAINNAAQKVLGIEGLQQICDVIERLRRTFDKSAASVRQDFMKMPLKPEAAQGDPALLRAKLTTEKTELAAKRQEYQTIQEQLQRHRLLVTDLGKVKSYVSAFSSACKEMGISFEPSQPLKQGVEDLANKVTQTTKELEKELETLSLEKGVAQNRVKYFANIIDLLESLSKSETQEGVPCPVCRRPIDSQLAFVLAEETRTNLDQAEQVLQKTNEELRNIREKVSTQRGPAQRINTLRTQIDESLPADLKGRSEISLRDFDDYTQAEEKRLQDIEVELSELGQTISGLAQDVDTETTALATADASSEVVAVREKLRNRVIKDYKGLILSSVLMNSIQATILDQRNLALSPLYIALGELWKKCRPDRNWQVKFDEEGRIKLSFDSTELSFSQLSGGEKTVLLILARVLISAMFSSVDFLIIDEPLEHLDARNRRSVLNFLVAANSGEQGRQTIVTTFEESLVRKYLENDRTTALYLTRGAP